MKRILALLILALLCAGVACAMSEGEPAVLTFSSFDGGGPEYWIEIDDPEIVTYTCERAYDDPDHDMMPGAGYSEIYTFVGLKPGVTGMTVSARSPIAENFDERYTVTVDDALNVSLGRPQAIARFSLYRHGELAYDRYDIVSLQGEYQVSVNGGRFHSVDASVVDALYRVFVDYDLAAWDGFDESREGVLDGEGFRLEIDLTDGTSVRAQGDNAFPERYFDAVGEMQDILDGIQTTTAFTMGGLLDMLSGLAPNG